ncbi:hypothetical protein B0H11DRAFT_2295214, partial [Mycena galericulata]
MRRTLRRRRMSRKAHQREWMFRRRISRHLGSTRHTPQCTHRLLARRRRLTSRPPQISTAASARLHPSVVSSPCVYLSFSVSRDVVNRVYRDLLIHVSLCGLRYDFDAHPRIPSNVLRLHLPRAYAHALLCIFTELRPFCPLHSQYASSVSHRLPFTFSIPQSICFIDYLEQASKDVELGRMAWHEIFDSVQPFTNPTHDLLPKFVSFQRITGVFGYFTTDPRNPDLLHFF